MSLVQLISGDTARIVDTAIFRIINGEMASPYLDPIMLTATLLGVGSIQAGISLLFILAGLLRNRLSLLRAGYAGLIAFLASGVVAQVAKHIWDRPRPPLAMFDVRMLDVSRFVHSFPSGHTTTAFAVAVAWSIFLPKLRWLFWGVAALAGISRIYLGAHFPLDVIFGAMIGSIVGSECAKWIKRRAKKNEKQVVEEELLEEAV